ncbi:MAG: hypothetical protein AAGD25_08735 [Cyanobacteria bacterium P01_F01_bin.150]
MSKKIRITLDDENLELINQFAGDRRCFINAVLWQEQRRNWMKGLAEAYTDQSNDPEFQQEFLVWDVAVGDGLDT